MVQPEFTGGVTDLSLPPERSEEGELTPPEGLPNTPAGWVERLSSLDFYKEHRKAIAIVGAAALAAGVGVYAAKHRGDKPFFVEFADRRAQQQGVISLGEIVENGAAVALPVGELGLQYVDAERAANTGSKVLFAMTGEPGEIAYPLRGGAEETSKYADVAMRAASWLKGHFSSQVEEAK